MISAIINAIEAGECAEVNQVPCVMEYLAVIVRSEISVVPGCSVCRLCVCVCCVSVYMVYQ